MPSDPLVDRLKALQRHLVDLAAKAAEIRHQAEQRNPAEWPADPSCAFQGQSYDSVAGSTVVVPEVPDAHATRPRRGRRRDDGSVSALPHLRSTLGD